MELEWLVTLLVTTGNFYLKPCLLLRASQVLREGVCKLLLRRGELLVFGLLQLILMLLKGLFPRELLPMMLLNQLLLPLYEHLVTALLLDDDKGGPEDDDDVDGDQKDGAVDEGFADGLSCVELPYHIVEEKEMVAENQKEVLVNCLQVTERAARVQQIEVEVAHVEQCRKGEDLDLQVWVQG